MANLEVITVLGAPSIEEGMHRVDAAAALYRDGIAPHLIITGAFWAFRTDGKPAMTIGREMANYAIEEQDIPQEAITVADTSLDTIGDALVVKGAMRDRGIHRTGLVTTDTHLPRSMRSFTHVLGPNYHVEQFDAGAFLPRRHQALYETLGNVLTRAVLSGTEAGDDEAIKERLFALVPGYADASKGQLLGNHLRSALGMTLRPVQPLRQLA